MIRNKKAFWTFVAAVALALALVITGSVFLSRTPKNAVITPAQGSTITRIARSYQNECWYYGDSAGNFVKMDEDGNEIARTVISEAGIRTVSADPKLDGVIVLDENYDLYLVQDRGDTLEKEFLRAQGGYQSMTADDEYLYFAVPASRYTLFVKYDKNDLSGPAVARGQMYGCSAQGNKYAFDPIISGTIVGMYTDADFLYIVTGEGQYHRMDKNFSLNRFAYMDEEELEELGAQVNSKGFATIPREKYDLKKYLTARKQLSAKGSAFDEENKRFYIAGADGEFAALSTEYFNEIENFELNLPNNPATGAITFHRESKTVYVGYQNISAVTAIDVEGATPKVIYQADVAFYISNMTVPAEGNRLLVICSGNDKNNPDFKELFSADIHTLGRKGVMSALGTLFLVFGILFAIVAVFAGFASFKAGFDGRCMLTLKGMARNWVTYLIILGSLAMLVLFCYYPGISSMFLSFFDYTRDNPTMRFNNFEHYIEIFTNPANLIAFRNMLIFLVSDIVIALVPPVLFAMCLMFMRNKQYGTFARIVLFLPSVLPGIATLLIWTRGIYGVDGVLNLIYKTFAGSDASSIQFLQDFGIPSLIMMGFPFVGSYLIFYGALMNVPPSFYEAAELDGCPLYKRIVMIDLPMISSQIKYVFILAFIQSVQNFGRVLMTTGGAFNTQIPIVLMYRSLQIGNYGLSSAYATLMFLVLIVATIFNMKIKTEEWEM